MTRKQRLAEARMYKAALKRAKVLSRVVCIALHYIFSNQPMHDKVSRWRKIDENISDFNILNLNLCVRPHQTTFHVERFHGRTGKDEGAVAEGYQYQTQNSNNSTDSSNNTDHIPQHTLN